MKHFIFLSLLVFLAACGSNNKDNQNSSEPQKNDSIANVKIPEIDPISDIDNKPPYYIVAVKAFAEKDSAILFVEELRQEYENANYLWIPDYESLSGKEYYQVFIGPFMEQATVIPFLMDFKQTERDAYAVLVDHKNQSRTIYSPFDIRQNGKSVKQIYIYSEPSVENAYYEDGGEDWGWFVNDVSAWFSENHPEVEFYTVYGDFLRDKDIKKLESELQLDGSFGYILIHNGKKIFIQHDPPDSIIDQACNFFGFSR